LEGIVDKEMKDALRKFVAGMAGEEEIVRLTKGENTYKDSYGHTLPAGEKTREEVLDSLVDLMRSLPPWFKAYHAEHGTYPEPPGFPDQEKEEKKNEET
jgi:hypothetical protein